MNSLFESAHFDNITWPSLYSPAVDVGFTGPPVRAGGYYLSDSDEVFRFTLYWMLIFHLPFNFLAGSYAFFNFLFPPVRPTGDDAPAISMLVLASTSSGAAVPPQTQTQTQTQTWSKPPRVNSRRSRLLFALLVLLGFLAFSLLSSVVGAAVVGFVLVGVYRAGGFYMSTWIPFVWAVIQSLIALLNIWPSVIDII